MRLKIKGKGKNTLRIEFEGEDHSLLNLLRKNLWKDSKIDSASYKKDHPYQSNPELLLKTKKGDPVKSLKRAARKVSDEAKEFRVELGRIL